MSDFERTAEVEQATREVERRKRELARSLERVEASSERIAQRLGNELKPALVGVAVVAGAAAVVGAVVLAVRARRRHHWLAPSRPSALGALARGVGVSVLRLAAQHAARVVAQRLAAAPTDASPGLGPVTRPQ
jgi:hypothetical protein